MKKENNNSYTRLAYVVRMSAIGDIVIAARAIEYFVKNNYLSVFVSLIKFKDVLLKIKDLKLFICLDDSLEPHYYVHGIKRDFKEFNAYCHSLQFRFEPLICDLQCTSRSKNAISVLQKLFFQNQTVDIYKVDKNVLKRFFLVMRSLLSFKQEKREKHLKIERIHDHERELLNKIFKKDGETIFNENHDKIFLEKSESQSTEKYVCIFPGASGFIKMWPLESFRTLIALLIEKTSYKVYICGGKEEVDLGEKFNNLGERVFNRIGLDSLSETFKLISNSLYVFTNDSFAAHVADAYQVPATVMFGPTSPEFGFVPIFSKIDIKYNNLSCSPCSRHGKGNCRFNNKLCLFSINPHEIFEDFISKSL